MSQAKYIKDLLIKTKMHQSKSCSAPLTSGHKFLDYGSNPVEDVHIYRSTVGALQYVTSTRPELAYSVNRVCQFMQQLLEDHWKVVKRILRYLAGTVDHGLHFTRHSDPSRALTLSGFSDADWGLMPLIEDPPQVMYFS